MRTKEAQKWHTRRTSHAPSGLLDRSWHQIHPGARRRGLPLVSLQASHTHICYSHHLQRSLVTPTPQRLLLHHTDRKDSQAGNYDNQKEFASQRELAQYSGVNFCPDIRAPVQLIALGRRPPPAKNTRPLPKAYPSSATRRTPDSTFSRRLTHSPPFSIDRRLLRQRERATVPARLRLYSCRRRRKMKHCALWKQLLQTSRSVSHVRGIPGPCPRFRLCLLSQRPD